jgi:hypothetical protein
MAANSVTTALAEQADRSIMAFIFTYPKPENNRQYPPQYVLRRKYLNCSKEVLRHDQRCPVVALVIDSLQVH